MNEKAKTTNNGSFFKHSQHVFFKTNSYQSCAHITKYVYSMSFDGALEYIFTIFSWEKSIHFKQLSRRYVRYFPCLFFFPLIGKYYYKLYFYLKVYNLLFHQTFFSFQVSVNIAIYSYVIQFNVRRVFNKKEMRSSINIYCFTIGVGKPDQQQQT